MERNRKQNLQFTEAGKPILHVSVILPHIHSACYGLWIQQGNQAQKGKGTFIHSTIDMLIMPFPPP